MEFKEFFKDFNIKKLLLCVLCSIVISMACAYIYDFSRNVYFSNIKEVIMDVELNNEAKEKSITYGNKFQDAVDGTIDNLSKRYGNSYPSREVVYSYLSLESFDSSLFFKSIIIGLVAGLLIYIVFFEHPEPFEALVKILLSFIIVILATKVIDLSYSCYVKSIVKDIGVISSNYLGYTKVMNILELIWTFLIAFISVCTIYGMKIVFTKEEKVIKETKKVKAKKSKK